MKILKAYFENNSVLRKKYINNATPINQIIKTPFEVVNKTFKLFVKCEN